jgi:hypothetical protein
VRLDVEQRAAVQQEELGVGVVDQLPADVHVLVGEAAVELQRLTIAGTPSPSIFMRRRMRPV